MKSQHKRAFRFHPNFKECRDCLRLVRKELYKWHREGWQHTRCPDCKTAKEITYDKRTWKTPRRAHKWTPDEETILTLAHNHGWDPRKVAQRLNLTLLAIQNHAVYIGLGPWPCYFSAKRRERIEQRKSVARATRECIGSTCPAPG